MEISSEDYPRSGDLLYSINVSKSRRLFYWFKKGIAIDRQYFLFVRPTYVNEIILYELRLTKTKLILLQYYVKYFQLPREEIYRIGNIE